MGIGGSADYKDRFLGAAVYLLALYDSISLAGSLAAIPALSPIFNLLGILLKPVFILYGVLNAIIPFGLGGLIVFFILLLAVVQNPKVPYFIRFNTMQTILIGIAVSLIQIILQTIPGLGLIGSAISVVAIGACIFCIVQCIMGRRPDIPSFSEFVYNFVPR